MYNNAIYRAEFNEILFCLFPRWVFLRITRAPKKYVKLFTYIMLRKKSISVSWKCEIWMEAEDVGSCVFSSLKFSGFEI